MFGTYHPPSQNGNFYFRNVGCALDVYFQTYDKILLTGDFNVEESEDTLRSFMELYDFKKLGKRKHVFQFGGKSFMCPLFLTNYIRSFQSNMAISTDISDCHKMIITVLKTAFKKAKAKINRI